MSASAPVIVDDPVAQRFRVHRSAMTSPDIHRAEIDRIFAKSWLYVGHESEIPEPGELVYPPRPSWAPACFAFGAAGAVCGIFDEGFMFRGWIYAIVGVVVLLCALRAMIKSTTRAYFRLPRRQHTRGAVLPVETISPPRP